MTKGFNLSAVSACVALALLFSFVGCGGKKNDAETTSAGDTSESVTTREPLNSVIIDLDTEKADTETEPSDTDDEVHDGTRLPLSLDMGVEYVDKFTFICDFSVYGLKPLGMLSDGQKTERVVSGIGGSLYVSSDEPMVYVPEYGGLLTVEDYVSRKKPEYLLLAVGASDIHAEKWPSLETFHDSYAVMLGKIAEASPDTVVVCMSVLPGSKSSGVNIYDAENYNRQILAAATETGVYYLDAASAFAGSDGYLRTDCDGGSSRLSTTGLRKLLDLVRTHYAEKKADAPAEPEETEADQ